MATFAWSTGGGLAQLTAGPTESALVLQMPASLPIPCLMVAELAWNGEHLALANDGASISMPNLMPGTTFHRS